MLGNNNWVPIQHKGEVVGYLSSEGLARSQDHYYSWKSVTGVVTSRDYECKKFDSSDSALEGMADELGIPVEELQEPEYQAQQAWVPTVQKTNGGM